MPQDSRLMLRSVSTQRAGWVLVAGAEMAARADLRQRLATTLPELAVVEAGDAWEMLRRAAGSQLVLLDGDLPDASAPAALGLLRHRHPDTPVILVDEDVDAEALRAALHAGATSMLARSAGLDALSEIVSAALAGHPALDAGVAGPALDEIAAELELAHEREQAVIESLATIAEQRDTESGRHLRSVSRLARQLAAVVEPAVAERDLLFGCLLHDVGKMGVPDEVLIRPGPLDPAEWELIRAHPEHGARLIEPLGLAPEVLQIVLYHHERWDGHGYPASLRGQGIPLVARIFSVCDALEALTAPRPWRGPYSAQDALEIVRHEAGRQFDPGIVAALERGLRDERIVLPAAAAPALPVEGEQTGRRRRRSRRAPAA